MKKSTHWPLSKEEQKRYGGWGIIYDDQSGEIFILENVARKRKGVDIKKIEKLFDPTCQPRCQKQPCLHHRKLMMRLV